MFETVARAQRSAELFCARYCCVDSSKVTATYAHASPSHSAAAGRVGEWTSARTVLTAHLCHMHGLDRDAL